jgi:hypothetical protein
MNYNAHGKNDPYLILYNIGNFLRGVEGNEENPVQ